jgi:gluconokinase
MADLTMPLHIVVMGVSGCGKSSVARRIADHLNVPFIEGDDLHSSASIERMSRGLPLNDDMRWPWLDRIASALGERPGGAVASCSALKRSYRERLAKDFPLFFLHLDVDRDVLTSRMTARKHFMPVSLLENQLQTLEPLAPEELGLTVLGSMPFDQLSCKVLSILEAWTDQLKTSVDNPTHPRALDVSDNATRDEF